MSSAAKDLSSSSTSTKKDLRNKNNNPTCFYRWYFLKLGGKTEPNKIKKIITSYHQSIKELTISKARSRNFSLDIALVIISSFSVPITVSYQDVFQKYHECVLESSVCTQEPGGIIGGLRHPNIGYQCSKICIRN